MKASASKSRSKHSAGRKPTQSAPLTQMLILDAVRTWVIPTIAAAVGLVIFVVYNIGILDEATAVTVVGGLALLVVLFYGLRGFFEYEMSVALIGVLAGFALLWGVATFYPFYRALNPGTPVFSTDLRAGAAVRAPLHDKAGHYSVIVEGHFLPVEGRPNRTASYHITVAHDGKTEHILEGTFGQDWRSQRIGMGRRSSVIPSLHETTQVRDAIDDLDGHDLTLQLTDLSPGVRENVSVRFYADALPQWALIGLGVLVLAAALLIDAWRPKGKSDGLMGTLAAATLVSLVIFGRSTVATPGFPQLIIAVLVGTLVGALVGSLLWRLTLPLKKYLPALE